MKSLTNRIQLGGVLVLAVLCGSCMKQAATKQPEESGIADIITAEKKSAVLPVQYQQAAYVLDQQATNEAEVDEESILKVGARISSTGGPQPLWDIVKKLVALKGMNVSWASDVDKNTLVDVDINPDDDFYQALDNMLRQVDYFHEVQGKTIVIKYRETRQFQIAMPFTRQKYSTAVGGNILGSSGSDNKNKQIDGILDLKSEDNTFDLWDNIKFNLDTILQVWNIKKEREQPKKQGTESEANQAGESPVASNAPAPPPASATPDSAANTTSTTPESYYIIDKPVGLITVTAPRPILDKIDSYLINLKKKLYKQIAIEAKIIEVQLDNESNIGINWNSVLKNFKMFAGALTFGADGQVYPHLKNNSNAKRIYTDINGDRTGTFSTPTEDGQSDRLVTKFYDSTTGAAFYNAIHPGQFISRIALSAANFEAFVNALKEEGQTKILSNPKISVMNGQPAMITVGQNRTYIDKVEVENDTDSNTKTYTTSTTRLLAGVGMALTATILDNKEIIMNLVPITSELVGNEIPYELIGSDGAKVGTPIINVREMSTTVKVGDGEMLVIGGLISDTESKNENFMPLLGDIPGIRYLFGYENKKHKKRELIILLRPKII